MPYKIIPRYVGSEPASIGFNTKKAKKTVFVFWSCFSRVWDKSRFLGDGADHEPIPRGGELTCGAIRSLTKKNRIFKYFRLMTRIIAQNKYYGLKISKESFKSTYPWANSINTSNKRSKYWLLPSV